jgi:uncharacterized membrane protein
MGKSWLEAFSDGVIAIIITIMMLELTVPHGATLDALLPLWPVFLSTSSALTIFLSDVLSFIYIAIYWNKLQYGNHPSIKCRHFVGTWIADVRYMQTRGNNGK